jgi:hypothetical protein
MERVYRAEEQPVGYSSFMGKMASWAFLCIVVAVLCVSTVLLNRVPTTVAVFRGGDAPQAFLVSLFFNGREPLVSETSLTSSQKHELARSILTSDDETLRRLSKIAGAEGRYAASSAGVAFAVDWPAFLGGGIGSWKRFSSAGWITNLTFPERVVLSIWAKTPPAAPWNPASTARSVPEVLVAPVTQTSKNSQATQTPSSRVVIAIEGTSGAAATVSSTAPLRVEIRNGCGITNAADLVARAAKDSGMQVMFVGNAQGPGRFRVPKSFIESRVGVPVAVEELCKRLAIPVSDVRENRTLKAGADVIVTVGRDYPKIRERLRARNQ